MSSRPTALTVLAAAAASAAIAVGCPVSAGATPGLVDDTNVSGYLGFCDTNKQQVRAGLLTAAPFAWTTVSSVPAPAGYEQGRTSIVAFQPRPQVDPIDWSGKQLTAASTFSNPKNLRASGTRIDSSFSDFTGTYTPRVDGLIQVRMYFTGVNKPQYVGAYPAVLVKVTGDRWKQVGGGAVDCGGGRSRSVELDTLPASRLQLRSTRPSPQTARQLRALATTKSGTTSGAAASAAASAATPVAAADSSVAARPAADTSRTRDEDSGTSWLWVGAAAVTVALVAGAAFRRRRTGRSDGA